MRLAILLSRNGQRRPEHPKTASEATSARISEHPQHILTASAFI